MGMFDSIYIKCPRCNNSVEHQTKSGSSLMRKYSLKSTSPLWVISASLGRHMCYSCELPFMVELIERPKIEVRELTEEELENE